MRSVATFLADFVHRYDLEVRVVLVHGSIANGEMTFRPVAPLAERLELVIPNRSGYPPNPPLERIDFEDQVLELEPLLHDGAHLVGHSYGGVISLLLAARRPEAVRSLTVSEPPAFGIARGDPAVDRLVAELDSFFAAGPYEPADYLRGFLAIVGSAMHVPDPLPPELEQGARAAMVERSPVEAQIPLDDLAKAPFWKLVISGAHNAAFDAVCDVLEERLGAERAVMPGAGHGVPRAPGYGDRLAAFISAAEASSG
jgi:pimeloyl-ACP methyl ester carboxylesterase